MKAAASKQELKRGSYECFILAVSLLSLTNLALGIVVPQPAIRALLESCDVVLSAILLLDFGIRLFSAPSKRDYLIRQYGWLDFLGSLPFPGVRAARLFRIVRVVRLLSDVGLRRLRRAALRDRAGSTVLSVLFLTLVLIEAASILVLQIEIRAEGANIRTASDALWWTYVTIATVGYGDRYPVTDTGRVVGVIVMTVGVVLYGAITAWLADAFIRRQASERDSAEADYTERREELRARLQAEIKDELRAEIEELRRVLRALRDESPARANPPDGER